MNKLNNRRAEPWVVDLAKQVVKATDKDKACQGPKYSVEEFTVTNFHNDDNTFRLEFELATLNDDDIVTKTNDARVALDIEWTLETVLKKIKDLHAIENIQDKTILEDLIELKSKIMQLKSSSETYLEWLR